MHLVSASQKRWTDLTKMKRDFVWTRAKRDGMKRIKLLIAVACSVAAASCAMPAPQSRLSSEHLNAWSNVTVTEGEDPHAYGIDVELWKHNGEEVGFLSEHVGSVADPPAGKLDSIQFDERTGKISFTVKLSTGAVRSTTGNDWVPAKNLYEFTGVIDSGAMTGLLRKTTLEDGRSATVSDENIVLKDKGADVKDNPHYDSYEKWSESWATILRVRGPKW